jgi:hypothetical protein
MQNAFNASCNSREETGANRLEGAELSWTRARNDNGDPEVAVRWDSASADPDKWCGREDSIFDEGSKTVDIAGLHSVAW